MKFFHIITVSESALKKRLKDRPALEQAIGAAVVGACWGLGAGNGDAETSVADYREGLAKDGLISYVDEFGDSDVGVYMCTDGKLVPFWELDVARLDDGIRVLQIHRDFKVDEDRPQ